MTTVPATDLLVRARAWLAEDPDPDTRAELTGLLAAAECGATGSNEGAGSEEQARAWSSLAERFSGTLRFGTAGLRAAMGAGPMRMNRTVVTRAAAGLAAHLRRTDPEALVVIGYDARHRSYEFALTTAATVVGAGLRAALLPGPLPTPVLAFTVRRLGAAAGVMVTASHNPAQDNGYKVYLADGAQIVPPLDAAVAAEIDALGPLASIPTAADGWAILTERETVEPYLARAVATLDPGSPRGLTTVYTPLHGVGRDLLLAAFARAGFPAPVVVPEQGEPDPDFPTLRFPNPEEPGALDLAFRTAARHAPDLVLAHDPDADRLAVAVPDPGLPGGWRALSGDEVGALLAAHLVARRAEGTFATTIVSSSLLARIAEAAGLGYAETLTGFKWITRAPGLRYGYEEALGYCVDPEAVRDKDGLTAALAVAELAGVLAESGRTLGDLLDDLALTHGLHATEQRSARLHDPHRMAAVLAGLRERPPTVLGGLRVDSAEDLGQGADGLPPTEGLRYRLSGDGVASARVVVRPSGTEPKLKCYLEVVVPVPSSDALGDARTTARELLAAIAADLGSSAGI
ncbi:phospho-sugar mutase [Streptacidiphilus albus]|uniref:phospho-sugar mutase n=1 Tax=Streptacidiphilus albus TaxID=105425 RepID=UPI00054BEDCB|nr:phospho-sugar mutase [Streptacidiphilus albus]